MSLNLLYETSQLPAIAKKHLKAIVESKEELITFLENFKPNYKNIMKAIAEFRMMKLTNRTLTIDDFKLLYEKDCFKAIQTLFLYPYGDSVERYVINQLDAGNYSLEQLYNFHQENLTMNPVLAGKRLMQLT